MLHLSACETLRELQQMLHTRENGFQNVAVGLSGWPKHVLSRRAAILAPRASGCRAYRALGLGCRRTEFFVAFRRTTQWPTGLFPCRMCSRIATASLPLKTSAKLGLSGRPLSWSTIRILTDLPVTRFIKANETGVSIALFTRLCNDICFIDK